MPKKFLISFRRSGSSPRSIRKIGDKIACTPLRRSGIHYFGARLEGRIVGLYKASITDKGLYGEHQTVAPKCRVTGLASAMYIQFAEYGRKHGCKRNYCNILVDHEVGLRLMKKFNFLPWGEPYEQAEGMWVQLYERPLNDE